jgi:hypothetical protein
VGTIALNDAVTTATMSPATPSSGQTFNLTGYSTTVTLPASLAGAAAALSPTLTGSANAQIDSSGATPATLPTGTQSFSYTIPSPVPAGGVPLQVPSTPATLGPFTATSSAITMQQDSSIALQLVISGAPLNLTCTAYPNNTITPSGITTASPTAAPIAPVIAFAGGGSTTTTTSPPATTTTKAGGTGGSGGSGGTGGSGATATNAAHAVTASSGSLAFTGPGPGVAWLVLIGAGLVVLGFALLVLVDAPRRVIAQLAVVNGIRLRRRRRDEREDPPSHRLGFRRPEIDFRSWAGHVTGGGRGLGNRMAKVPERSRELAQTTARHAVRTASWLLGR